jgi:hypothetical protein
MLTVRRVRSPSRPSLEAQPALGTSDAASRGPQGQVQRAALGSGKEERSGAEQARTPPRSSRHLAKNSALGRADAG